MLTPLFFHIVNRWPKGRRVVFRWLFEFLARRTQYLTTWTQMNYGYADGPDHGETAVLEPRHEHERYCHQLYLKTVNGFDLSHKDVVEVSCGRGGGAAYMHHYLHPRSMTGVDIAAEAVRFCREVHRAPGLRFLQGDAEDLPLFDASADAVINVESSFCYAALPRFLAEVQRVLRPGGLFLYADLRHVQEMPKLEADIAASGMERLCFDDITPNVVRALKLDAGRRIIAASRHAPRGMRHFMRAFAGTPGSRIPTLLENGSMRYFCFALRKPESAAAAQRERELPAASARV